MELLKVYFTERSWCGYWPQFEILLMVYSAGIWIPLQFTRHYNSANLVRSTLGCTGSTDPIACLRTLPFDMLMTAVNKSPERTFCFEPQKHAYIHFYGSRHFCITTRHQSRIYEPRNEIQAHT